MTRKRQLHLGAILSGVGTTQNGWRHPDLPGDASVSIDWYIENARKAEAAKFDLVFIVDSPFITPDTAPHFLNRLEPLTLLSAVAVATSRIGLAGTLTTSFWEPYNVARQFGSLDLISKGRAGWNVVTTGLEGAAGNYSRDEHFDHALRYRRAAEFLDVVKGLWDSYEDDAFPRDKAAGRFLDKAKQHRLDHRGEFFSVTGPLNIQRSRQGQPVIFQAGASDDGRNFAARRADAIFAATPTYEDGLSYYTDVKARAKGFGRDPEQLVVLPGISPIVGATDAEAEAKYRELAGLESLETGLGFLSRSFNDHDFRQYDLDAPFPDVEHIGLNSQQSATKRILGEVRAENLTLRQVVQRLSAPRGAFVGSPETIANELQRWFENGAADGFVVFEPLPGQLELFVELVVPILQARGLFREDYEGATFRESLGLPVPTNRYTAARASRSAA